MRRRCARHVHQQRSATAQIEVPSVKIEPVEWRPIIAGRAAEDRARLEADYCFPATPVTVGVVGITRGDEGIVSITGNAANSPYGAAKRICRPCHYTARVIDGHPY